MAKQVTTTSALTLVGEDNSTTHNDTVGQTQPKNLYITIITYDGQTGKVIGQRVVDMYHYGTRNWLQNHIWWAMHHGHPVEQVLATDEDIGSYMAQQEIALHQKFGAPKVNNTKAETTEVVEVPEVVAA